MKNKRGDRVTGHAACSKCSPSAAILLGKIITIKQAPKRAFKTRMLGTK